MGRRFMVVMDEPPFTFLFKLVSWSLDLFFGRLADTAGSILKLNQKVDSADFRVQEYQDISILKASRGRCL